MVIQQIGIQRLHKPLKFYVTRKSLTNKQIQIFCQKWLHKKIILCNL